ncbi:transporter [Erysipelothrix sp. HDW6C]|uniref:Na+/H+ antiporter NhaC family protein n=1 Tax=Erysipelothrix sp. HDW6C TaxID=2714930 RepID=UPI00140DEF39|nr:Na+/H+ antiporter NhaC family protein [Erysipelothrix sp. HDW6C]QIK68820.1 transporter [Erysipelothrix sp. HDW6C]
MDTLRLILIFGTILTFIVLMMKKKVPTIIALPMMGFIVALIATVGNQPMLGLFDYQVLVDGEMVTNPGIFSFVITDGVKMMAGAVATVIFASSFSKLLMKQNVIEKIIKTAAEYAGDRPLVLALVFYVVVSVIFMAIGGLGGIILVGSIILPIMLSAGIKPLHAGTIFLFAFSSGGVLNPMNYSTFIPLLAPMFGDNAAQAQQALIQMSWPMYIVAFLVPLVYVFRNVKGTKSVKSWAADSNIGNKANEVSVAAMFAPIVPVVILIGSQILKFAIPAEIAIVIGILYVLLTTKSKNSMQLITQSFLEGTQDVAGVILLMIGLGILIKGVQYPAVQVIVGPSISFLVQYLQNPLTYVIGFTLGSLLALYRGPLNTYGIGGALPALFGAAGFSPIAIIWALRANGNMQGFGDPTNSQNIWVADFVNVDVNDILKEVLVYGMVISLLILSYAVFVARIPLAI